MEQEIKLLLARAQDAVRLSETRNIPKFLGFLSPGEAAAINQAIHLENAVFFGGYEGAERRMFGVFPTYITDHNAAFPISAIGLTYRETESLTHRDILGALMSTGVKRSFVGDILVSPGGALIYAADEIAGFLTEQITKVRNVGVKTVLYSSLSELPPQTAPRTETVSFTVSSARLDAVVSGLTGFGRTRSEQMIADGKVFVNSFAVIKPTKKVQPMDCISLRGVGKFVITGMGSFSKKGREIITAEKYL